MRNAAQRWFKFDNMGPSPHRRSYHAMASDGTRVFVLGGFSKGAGSDEVPLIHGFDTSMYFRSVISSGQPPRLRTQSTLSTRNPSVTRSILMRRPPNMNGSHPQVPRPRSNHSTGNPLYRRPRVLPVCKTLPPLIRAVLPFTSETPVRMIVHRKVSQEMSRKTMSGKVQPASTMGSSRHFNLLLKEKLQGWSSNGSCRHRLLYKLSGATVLHS
jgi:hypothetical protein